VKQAATRVMRGRMATFVRVARLVDYASVGVPLAFICFVGMKPPDELRSETGQAFYGLML
jgi:hypothetical protein